MARGTHFPRFAWVKSHVSSLSSGFGTGWSEDPLRGAEARAVGCAGHYKLPEGSPGGDLCDPFVERQATDQELLKLKSSWREDILCTRNR